MDHPMIPPTKRRRLQESAASLSKPFRSPLRKSAGDKLEAPPALIRETNCAPENDNAAEGRNAVEPLSQSQPSRAKHIDPVISKTPRSSVSSPEKAQKPAVSNSQLSELQREHSSLLRQFSKLRQDLDTAQQAEKIESSGQDAELEFLINKWKVASRELAEQVFRTAKDRVNRMGGVDAWRERSQRPSAWEEDEETSTADLSDEQREAIEMAKEEMQQEAAKYGSKSPISPEKEKENESFTMDMMLKTLNIDLHLIGYDKDNQRWDS